MSRQRWRCNLARSAQPCSRQRQSCCRMMRKGAEQILQEACRKATVPANAWYVLAEFYIGQKRFADAEASLRKGAPDRSQAHAFAPRFRKSGSLSGTEAGSGSHFQAFVHIARQEYPAGIYGLFLAQEGRFEDGIRELKRLCRRRSRRSRGANTADRCLPFRRTEAGSGSGSHKSIKAKPTGSGCAFAARRVLPKIREAVPGRGRFEHRSACTAQLTRGALYHLQAARSAP